MDSNLNTHSGRNVDPRIEILPPGSSVDLSDFSGPGLERQKFSSDSSLSMGRSVVQCHGLTPDGQSVVVTHNYTSAVLSADGQLLLPYHLAPNPKTDWYLNFAALSAAHSGETVLILTLQPGVLDYYRETGILADGARVIEVNPDLDAGRLGYPFSDPLSQMIRQGIRFEGQPYFVASFPSNLALEQARELGAIPIQLSDPRETSNKAAFRGAAADYGYAVLPGVEVQSERDLDRALALFAESPRVWMKLAHGGGGDTVLPISGPITSETLLDGVRLLKETSQRAFAEADFGSAAAQSFWPEESLLPVHSQIVIEQDANVIGQVLINGSSILVTNKNGEVEIPGHSIQRTGPMGDYRGTMPYHPPVDIEALIASEMARVGQYCTDELKLYGVVGVDWMLVRAPSGELKIYNLELNGRPSSSSMALATANKIGVSEYININLHSDTPINNIADFERKVTVAGHNFARGDLETGRVIPLTLNSQYIRNEQGDLELIAPAYEVKVLVACNQGLDRCEQILALLKSQGLSEDP